MKSYRPSLSEKILNELKHELIAIEKFQYNKGLNDLKQRLLHELPDKEGVIQRVTGELLRK